MPYTQGHSVTPDADDRKNRPYEIEKFTQTGRNDHDQSLETTSSISDSSRFASNQQEEGATDPRRLSSQSVTGRDCRMNTRDPSVISNPSDSREDTEENRTHTKEARLGAECTAGHDVWAVLFDSENARRRRPTNRDSVEISLEEAPSDVDTDREREFPRQDVPESEEHACERDRRRADSLAVAFGAVACANANTPLVSATPTTTAPRAATRHTVRPYRPFNHPEVRLQVDAPLRSHGRVSPRQGD